MGFGSISNSKYDPPCKSKPRLIFLSKKLSSIVVIFEIAKKDKVIVNIKTVKIFNFEKYNTFSKNYFFCSVSPSKA